MGPTTPLSERDGAALDQLRFLEETLRRTQQRYADVSSTLIDAEVALEEAKRRRDTLSTEADSLNASLALLRQDIRSLRLEMEISSCDARAARVCRLLARFPCELLRCIFVQARQRVEDVWSDEHWGTIFYGEQTRIPFILASVDRKWREVALLTPSLWSFVGVGALRVDDCDGSPDLAYVKLALRRSKRGPLDIFLGWADCDWTTSTRYADILGAVGRHAHRWRRASITFPQGAPESALHLLRSPMPALEGLLIGRANEERDLHSAAAPSTYLPFCPSLRRLINGCLFVVPRSPQTSLTSAYIDVGSSSLTEVWAFLGMLPAVRRLILDFVVYEDPPQSFPPQSVTLSNLRHFALVGWSERFSTCVGQLQVPGLEELQIDSDNIATFSPLFEKVAHTLTTLIVRCVESDGPFPTEHISHIRKLQKLRNLVLRGCSMLAPEFSAVFASREAAGLPLFESVSIQAVLDEDKATHVCDLMQKLHARSASGTDGAVTFSLATGDEGDVPAWLLRQYKFITTGECDSDSECGHAAGSEVGSDV